MSDPVEIEQNSGDAAAAPFAEFLESVPPSQTRPVQDLLKKKKSGSQEHNVLHTPQLQLHCTHDTCNGPRFFRCTSDLKYLGVGESVDVFLDYICSNCRVTTKRFSLHLNTHTYFPSGRAYKYGEQPPFGIPTPPRMLRMFGNDRDVFLKGRRCENQGLGIGAFSYYRRVVEHHKNQILDEVLKVAEQVSSSETMVTTLRAAKEEIQFSKAMASVRDAIPQSLLINGQNPLTLLHSALSIGLHEESDERCLELAHDVRVVLAELAERIGQALKDEDELNAAVTRLMNAKAVKAADGSPRKS